MNKEFAHQNHNNCQCNNIRGVKLRVHKWLFKADHCDFVVCWMKQLSKRHIKVLILQVNSYVSQKTKSSNVIV